MRLKTPTAVLAKRGSWRAKIREGEPEVLKGELVKPTWLSDEANSIWEAVIPQLRKMGVLSTIDGLVLSRYCETWVLWRAALDSGGNIGKYDDILRRTENAFGMSPAARASLSVERPKKESKTVSYIKKVS